MPKEVMKALKPTKPDTDEVLPGIYGTKYHAPVFEDRSPIKWQRISEYEKILKRNIDSISEGKECSEDIVCAGPPAPKDPYYADIERSN
jgi:hypothetical protein